MRDLSSADLKRFREMQAQSARQRAAKEAGCYRVQADVFKALAANTNLQIERNRFAVASG